MTLSICSSWPVVPPITMHEDHGFLRVRGSVDTFGGTLTELRAGSLVTDRSAVIAPYEHLLLLPAGSDSEPARRCGDASIKRAARQLLACGNRNLSHDGGNEYDAYGCSREYPDIQILGFSDAGSLARVKFPETVRSIHHGDRSEAR